MFKKFASKNGFQNSILNTYDGIYKLYNDLSQR